MSTPTGRSRNRAIDPVGPLVVIVVAAVCLAYTAGVYEAARAIVAARKPAVDVLEKLLPFTTAIGAVLATTFGAIFGVNVPPSRSLATLPLIHRWAQTADDPAGRGTWSTLQIAAAYLYFASLLAAFVVWMFGRPIGTPPLIAVQAIEVMAKTAMGVALGMLTIALKVRPRRFGSALDKGALAPGGDLKLGEKVPAQSEAATVGAATTRIRRGTPEFAKLVKNVNPRIVFKDEEGTGADRMMTPRLRTALDAIAEAAAREPSWPSGTKLRVTEAWDENDEHSANSTHYEGRAADITTSDNDRGKLGRLARLAVEAGCDWVFYEDASHVHVSVRNG